MADFCETRKGGCLPRRTLGQRQLPILECERRTIKSETLPFPPAALAIAEASEMVVVEHCADIAGRMAVERVVTQKAQDIWRAFHQPHEETDEPRIALHITQSREPHLPVQARLVRSDGAWM